MKKQAAKKGALKKELHGNENVKKVALVTGSAKRLGQAIAFKLASEGYFTWVHYMSSKKEAMQTLSQIVASGGEGALVKGDVASKNDIRSIVKTIKEKSGRIDVLVNNVGIYKTGKLTEFSVQDFELIMNTNLMGAFFLIQQALPLFTKAGGSIINIGYASVESLAASTHNTAYLISKTGLYVLTKSLAAELGPRGIRVNMVSPGILSNSVELPKNPKDQVPLGRLGSVADVCNAVAFLIGEQGNYITGVNMDIAGGYMLKLKGLEG